MDGVRDQLFTSPAFAAHQHGGIPFRHLTDGIKNLPHGLCLTDHVVKPVLTAHLTAQTVAFRLDRFVFAVHLADQTHRLSDQVGHHLHKAGSGR